MDSDGDHILDKMDSDGDKVADSKDIFPENKNVQKADFSKVMVVRLLNGYRQPQWKSFHNVRNNEHSTAK